MQPSKSRADDQNIKGIILIKADSAAKWINTVDTMIKQGLKRHSEIIQNDVCMKCYINRADEFTKKSVSY